MSQKTEVYAYLHRMEAGMLTVSPKPNLLNQQRIPASEVEFEVMVGEPRKILLRITEDQAHFYGFKQQDESSDKPANSTAYYRDIVRTIPDQILADEAQYRLDRMRGVNEADLVEQFRTKAMATKLAPTTYTDESQALHIAHSESGAHSGVDYELHRGPAPSILDKLPNVSRPITDTLKKVAKSFE